MYSTKPRNSKWAVVNDGDDGDDNDDEDALNKIWMMESFKEQNFFSVTEIRETMDTIFWQNSLTWHWEHALSTQLLYSFMSDTDKTLHEVLLEFIPT